MPKRPAFTIRPASPEDAGVLADLRGALFAELRLDPEPSLREEFATAATEAFTSGLASGSCLAWLAKSDAHEAVGSVALLIFPRLPSPKSLAPREGYLLNVYIVPEWRDIGVATALVIAAIARGRELGLARIRLHATAAGRSVYAAAGFASRDDEMELRL